MTNVLIVGYGNVGKGVHRAIERNPDMQLAGIITRNFERVVTELGSEDKVYSIGSLYNIRIRETVIQPMTDVAILCGGSKNDLPNQGPLFAKYFNTVDSFDTHADIPAYFDKMHEIAVRNHKVAVISTGWDPGTFSLERVLADAFIPSANHYTFWGSGVSQGHSDAARQVKGVKDARSYTHPFEDAMKKVRDNQSPSLNAGQKHYREVYVVAEDGADRSKIESDIRTMPNYFADYKTTVHFITGNEMKENHSSYPHGGFVMATGKTGKSNNALIEYKCEWGSNPEATGSILVAHARAADRLAKEGRYGAYTILDIPATYLSPHSRETLLQKFM